MKTKEEILSGKYTIESNGNEVVFNEDTPKELARLIVNLQSSRERIVLDYGDTETNKSWGESYDIVGRIGFSKGFYDLRWPILVYNARSLGGSSILTHRILSIRKSKGKQVIYQNKANN